MPDYPLLHLIMDARVTISNIQQHIIITKARVKFQPDWFKIFKEKVKKSHRLCINQAQ